MSHSMSLDDLVALNDEIAGLVRAGIPLEMGLASWSGDVSGQLGRTVARLGNSIERGRSLSESLADDRAQIPPVYGAVVTAGLKSGRLPAALESLATSARNLRDVRSALGLAAVYPLVLLLVGYCLFLLLILHVIPALMSVYEGRPPRLWPLLNEIGTTFGKTVLIRTGGFIILLPPALLLVSAAIWWFRTRRALVLDVGTAGWWLSAVPVASRTVRHARTAAWAEILGLLIEHGVPLHEAVVLAAECTGNRKLVQSARLLSASLEQGGTPTDNEKHLRGLPPLLAWLIASRGQQRTLTAMARHVAETYRRRTLRDAQWLRDFLPMWLVVIVGGSMVALFGVMLFLPFSHLMEALSGLAGHSMRIH